MYKILFVFSLFFFQPVLAYVPEGSGQRDLGVNSWNWPVHFSKKAPTHAIIEDTAFRLIDLQMTLGLTSPSIFSESHRNEFYSQVLLVKNERDYCVIPLNNKLQRKLNTQEILEQNKPDFIAFEQMKDLKQCQPGVAQAVLNSIDESENQYALAGSAIVIIAAIYLVTCVMANSITDKRNKVKSFDNEDFSEFLTRSMVAVICAPIYITTTIIRWGINDSY